MKQLTPREVQLGELEVLKKLAQICREQNLRYYLAYGTLLGAVRHQGFIPWDDDIDVMMPRHDYEKLLAYIAQHEEELYPLKLMNYRTSKEYIYPISRLCDTRYYIDYQGALDYGLGLFVDIYPLDGCGNSPEEYRQICKKPKNWLAFSFQAGLEKFQKSSTGGWRTPIKFLVYCYARMRGARYFSKKLDEYAVNFSYDDYKNVGCIVWDLTEYCFPKEMLAETDYLQFEDAVFAVPAKYDEMLKLCYGDYMKLPPEEDQVGHHYYKAYLKDEFV